jgi:cation transport regulator ChaB
MKDKKFESAIKNVAQEMALLKQENDLLREQLRISEHRNKILHKYINSQFDKYQEKEKKNDRYN